MLERAVRVAKRACERVKDDTHESCLANEEPQEALERLLLRFGEALKALPAGFLVQIDARRRERGVSGKPGWRRLSGEAEVPAGDTTPVGRPTNVSAPTADAWSGQPSGLKRKSRIGFVWKYGAAADACTPEDQSLALTAQGG